MKMFFDIETLEFNKILNKLSDFCQTNYAKNNCLNIKPTSNIDEVTILQNETSEALNIIERYNIIPLGGLLDVKEYILRSRVHSILKEDELLKISNMIRVTKNVIDFNKEINNLKLSNSNLNKYIEKLIYFKNIESNINLAINEEGIVVDNASHELFLIRRNLSLNNNKLRNKMQELLIKDASHLTDNVIVIRNNRLCLPVKAEHKNIIKGIIHDESASKTTVYIEPLVCVEINVLIEKYIFEERKEIEAILKGLTLLVGANADDLICNLENLTALDLIFAKAAYAKFNEHNTCNFNNEGIIDLKKARHPLIDREKVVPIDIDLGKNHQTIIITGPNTGGKTVALKTVGLLSLMFQSGLFIPAKNESDIAIFDNIFVDIGDEQSIEQSLSTFSSHMTKIINILNNITLNSLVLLDELGSGTDPKEGSCLAISIIEYLHKRGTRIICTTHYSDLKAYAFNTLNVCNASVEFNIDTLKPTYRLLMGVAGKSNAIDIAYKLGLNSEVINFSKTLMQNISTDSQTLMEALDLETLKVQNLKQKLEEELKIIETEKNQIILEKNKIQKDTDKIIKNANLKASEIINKAKEESTELLNKISLMASDSKYLEHELADVKYKVRNLKVKEENQNVFNEELKVGDYVTIKAYNKTGAILKIKNDKYEVSVGQFSMSFKKDELIKTTKPTKKERKITYTNTGYQPTSRGELSLDLRGKRYEEVSYLMDDFLDQAYLGRLQQVTIIHGFGSGVIRDCVQKYLKACPYVKSYRYGEEGEGLNGVTVVSLK